jgi:hypothetical protein
MSRNRLLALGLSIAVVAVWLVVRRGEIPAAVDLVAKLAEADKRPANAGDDLFSVSRETIAGDTRRAVFVRPTTRITWDLTLPNKGLLRTAMGIDPSVWDRDSDGVQFRIGISTGNRFEPLMVRRVDPHHVPADRGWIPVTIDLARYSGQQVHLVLATDPGTSGSADTRDRLAYWAAPAITLR